MVRRTRSNIQHEPRYSGEIHFPELLDPTVRTYEMTPHVYELFYETYRALVAGKNSDADKEGPSGDSATGLTYARYRAVEYCPKYIKANGGKAKQVADQLAAIYQTHMVKRLESSFYAFKRSLHTLLQATLGMIKMFEEDKVIIAPELNVKKLQSDGMELDAIIELALNKGYDQDEILYRAADFSPEFLPMLQEDAALLGALCKQWDAVDEDSKLDRFIEMLQGELFETDTNPTGKLVVFSESVDTVNYLEEELKKRLHRDDILAVYSKNRNRLRETVRANFTRLMQRIGRVNRIGSKALVIYNYMFYPSDPGDKIISLKKNSLIKLQSFHSALGEDTRIYSHEEMVHEFHLFNSDVQDDTDRSLELLREVRKLHDSNPTLYRRIKQLPCKSRCARETKNNTLPQLPIHTITYLSSPKKKAFYLVGEHILELSFLEAATLMKAEMDEHAVPFGDNMALHYELVRSAMAQYTIDQQRQHQEDKPKIGSKDNDAKKAAAFLRDVRPSLPDDDARKTVDVLKALVERGKYNQLADSLNRLSRKHKKSPLPIIEIVVQLEELKARYSHPDKETPTQTSAGITADIILSETFFCNPLIS